MDRRQFFKSIVLGGMVVGNIANEVHADFGMEQAGEFVKDYLTKIKNFDTTFADDIILKGDRFQLLKRVAAHLQRLQSAVGYANYSLIGFDQAVDFGKRYSSVGVFTQQEKDFLESVFYTNAREYGFFGDKVLTSLTQEISNRDIVKIPRTGHYVFRGEALRMYQKIRNDVGSNVLLTSGVRGIIKQMDLFLNKAIQSNGNLSMASRSLAPPGHSYHGIGDFDVGKVGYGPRNFTEDFAQTDEFKRLIDLGYIRIRYDETNPFGVRYEPWHVKVV